MKQSQQGPKHPAVGQYTDTSIHKFIEEVKQTQKNILIEDQIRNDFRVMGEAAAESSAPRNRIERIGWFVIAFANAAAALALTSMMLEDRFYPGLLIVGVFLIFSYKLFRKALRRS